MFRDRLIDPVSTALDLRVVIDGLSEGFALLDANFIILDVNAETLRMESRTREELVGRSHWEAYPGSEDSELGRLYKKAMREQVQVHLEHVHHWGDGREMWLEMRAFPIAGEQLAVLFRDVTERHAAERKLHESEARFRAAVDAFTDALWTNDPTGQMMGEQPGWAALTGQSLEQYQGFGWAKAVHSEDAQPTIDAWNVAVAERREFAFEHRVLCRDGIWRRFAIRAVPVFETDGAIREWVGVHRDITAAAEAAAQIVRNAETFEDLVSSNPFGIYVIDSGFRLLHASLGCAGVFAGIEPLIGRDFAEVLRIVWQDPFASEAIAQFRHTLATGETHISQRTVENRQNVEAIEAYDWRIDRIVLPDGEFGVVCYFYDLSERVELETSLRQALDDKDMLLREIDHRVRNSLAMVSSLIGMQRGATKDGEVKAALAVAAARLQAVSRIHERLYLGKQLGVVQFDRYLTQVCEDLRQSIGRAGTHFELETTPVRLKVDTAIPLGLITNELVTNAFKHCQVSDSIILRLERSADGATLTIGDDGRGMPVDFDPRAKVGLGMQVIELLVSQIGGDIAFPQAGATATFVVTIPARVLLDDGEGSDD